MREKVLSYVYRMNPVAYFPNPIPPLSANQEMILQEFFSYINTQVARAREEEREKIKDELSAKVRLLMSETCSENHALPHRYCDSCRTVVDQNFSLMKVLELLTPTNNSEK